ncbi:MAG: bifunctional riboflavin kinase/FAD synthetase [Alphaproteobacteria bacterium]
MRIVRHAPAPGPVRAAVVALGNFDGLHRGHRAVIGEAGRIARAEGRPWGVLTFEPHPRQVFQPTTVPFRITPFRTKARLLAGFGVDVLFALRFSAEVAGTLAQDFVVGTLLDGLAIAHVVTGPEFVFGKGRRGNGAVLARMAAMEGFRYSQVATETYEGVACSATEIRVLLRRGLVAAAAHRLGREWEYEGRVAHGANLGRKLGYPTANLATAGRLIPSPGIYAVRAGLVEGGRVTWRDAVASLGTRPTFDGEDTLLEVHVFDFAGDLYGRRLRVAFVDRLRKELRFPDAEALKAQMAEDCRAARAILARHPMQAAS